MHAAAHVGMARKHGHHGMVWARNQHNWSAGCVRGVWESVKIHKCKKSAAVYAAVYKPNLNRFHVIVIGQ